MRFLSVLTAILVSVVLYAVVFERDRLMEFAGATPNDPMAAPDETVTTPQPAQASTDTSETADVAEEARRVAVVFQQSVASQVDTAVTLRGQTEAVRHVDVQSETSGRVISEPLRKGAFVTAGDTLCQIDPGIRQAQLDEAEASLAEAQISDTAASRLAEGGFASETRAVGAKATLQSARAAVQAAKTELGRLVIAAPFDGVLDTDTAELGSLMQPGAHCATILQLNPIKIVAYVPETLVDSVQLGAGAQARLSSGRDVQGKVTFLSRSADQATRTFRVEITAANDGLTIRDGQSAEVAIAAEGVAAHRIPASALTLDDQGNMGLRTVDDTDTVQFFPVRVLRDTSDGVIVTGLPDSVRIITTGQEFVMQGVKVRAVEAENAT
ncbi:efflux RND transporter periplasmic adaptor subunit [Meridianimarinicoccus aquatilis]|uniref:Efflux RND transporter periplasmic adaptor subunit n=1 Tax=Meridianimarinicoccus aquatilis TaxID=2552766 RepID=A0A4R6AT37_9RHOB|nr:efflux RND transporter periplasmic adaptor subunit [Fluviibacterium aquatile]TDL86815.1 efflux RND transporter periplasmic adaptor subunit [Fluviibacterium aquatile]